VVESVVIASGQSSMLVQRWWQQGSQWVMVRMHIVACSGSVFFLFG
jgi:hypothetical protein